MQRLPRWGYFLLAAACLIGSVVWLREVDLALLLISLQICNSLYEHLGKVRQRKWLVPCGIVLALALGVSYYIADLLIFPHSAHAAHRVHTALFLGPLYAFGGLLAAYCSPGRKRVVQDHAMNGTAKERGR